MLGLLSALMSKEQQLQLNCLALDLRRCQQSLKNDSEGIVRERIESVWLQEILKKNVIYTYHLNFYFPLKVKWIITLLYLLNLLIFMSLSYIFIII